MRIRKGRLCRQMLRRNGRGIGGRGGQLLFRLLIQVPAFLKELFNELVFASVMSDERDKRLARVRTLVALVRRLDRNSRRDLLIEMLRTIMIVQSSRILQNLLANLAVVIFRFIDGPIIAQFLLHEPEELLMGKGVMPSQIVAVFGLVSALGAFKRPSRGNFPGDDFAEMREQMGRFIPHFVHARREFFAAQFARGHAALDVDHFAHGQRGQVRDVLDVGGPNQRLFAILQSLLLLVLKLDDVDIAS